MIKVLLADDERLIREAVATMVGMEDDIDVVGVAVDGREALEAARKLQPDVAVLDLQMPELDGISVAKALAADYASVPCIIVTSYALPGTMQSAMAAGVRGFAPKNISTDELADIIRTVASGKKYVDPALAAEAMTLGESPLTPRETQLLKLALKGSLIEEIAQQVHLSPSTARNHISAAVTKLGVANRHEAAQMAVSRGWI